MGNNIHVSVKDIQRYKNCSYPTAIKRHRQYQEKAGHKSLTIFDIRKVDRIPVEHIAKQMFNDDKFSY